MTERCQILPASPKERKVKVSPKTIEKPRRRTRLSPELRRDLILDAAAKIVTERGVSFVSMEETARVAGVSKSLVYNYFPSRLELLGSLLQREYDWIEKRANKSIRIAKDFETLIRTTTRDYLDHVAERGVIIQRLTHDPHISKEMGEVIDVAERRTQSFIIKMASKKYKIPRKKLTAAIRLLQGLSGVAGDYLYKNDADVDFVEELCVTLILGGLEKLSTE